MFPRNERVLPGGRGRWAANAPFRIMRSANGHRRSANGHRSRPFEVKRAGLGNRPPRGWRPKKFEQILSFPVAADARLIHLRATRAQHKVTTASASHSSAPRERVAGCQDVEPAALVPPSAAAWSTR